MLCPAWSRRWRIVMKKKGRRTRAERLKQKHQFDDLAALLESTPAEYRANLYEKLERERIAESMAKSGKKKRGGGHLFPGVSRAVQESSQRAAFRVRLRSDSCQTATLKPSRCCWIGFLWAWGYLVVMLAASREGSHDS